MVTSRAVVGSSAKERHGDHDPLTHAAGEFVRIHVEAASRLGNAHAVEHRDRRRPRLGLAHAAMGRQHLGHLPADPQIGIERGHRVLEDHGDAAAADPVQFLLAQADEFGSAEAGAPGRAAIGGQETHDRQEHLALARAGLADDADGLALADGEAQVVDRLDLALGRVEARVEMSDLE